MCTIFGYFGTDMTRQQAEDILARTVSRGPDETRILQLPGKGILAFQRLAIMGLTESGMQPFNRNGAYCLCNGEIYGFREQRKQLKKKGYVFQSNSDCEILLPLYEEYGLSMFSHLDAEFALLLWDEKRGQLIAARDPIGIRPLFYGYSKTGAIAFASEARSLTGLVDKIFPFPPGCYYVQGRFERYSRIGGPERMIAAPCEDEKEFCRNIREKLIAGVEKRLDSDAPLGFLLSGGLDSSLVCAIGARKLKRPIRTFAIGMEKDAIDLKYARIVAEHLGADHTEFYMTPEMVIQSLREVIYTLGTFDITTIRASIGMYLLCKAIHRDTDIRVLLTGEISDELFGYKYTDFAPDAEAFQRESEKRIRELHCYDVLRADRCIADNSMEARVPFGDLDFVSYVLSVNPELKMNRHGMGKYLLRKAFEEGDWLPEQILWREKAAFSDAVGHSMVDDLKAYAEQQYGSDWKERCRKYKHAAPFTKESLLYREIFETFYPGQAEMIPDFWMPNRSWKGCDVDDPSARVLQNYGKSGE